MGGCCIGDCCVMHCGFCCILDFSSSCGDCSVSTRSGGTSASNDEFNAEVLRDLNDRCTKEAAEETSKCMDYLMKHIEEMISEMSKLNEMKSADGYSLNLDIKYLTQSLVDTKDSLKNYISDKVKTRLVLEDCELSVILCERNENKRNKGVNDFYNRVFNNAQSELISKIKEAVREQCSLVKDQLNKRKEEIALSIIKQEGLINDVNKKYTEESAKHPELVSCVFELSCADILSKKLEESFDFVKK